MAQKRNDDLFNTLRGYGLRRKVADEVARVDGARGRAGSEGAKFARQTIEDLTNAAEEIRNGVLRKDRKRGAAAQKAARTRKRKAAERSASARKAAQTRTRVSRAWKRTTKRS